MQQTENASYKIVQESTATAKKHDCKHFTEFGVIFIQSWGRQILAGFLLVQQANLHRHIWQNSHEEIVDKNYVGLCNAMLTRGILCIL